MVVVDGGVKEVVFGLVARWRSARESFGASATGVTQPAFARLLASGAEKDKVLRILGERRLRVNKYKGNLLLKIVWKRRKNISCPQLS